MASPVLNIIYLKNNFNKLVLNISTIFINRVCFHFGFDHGFLMCFVPPMKYLFLCFLLSSNNYLDWASIKGVEKKKMLHTLPAKLTESSDAIQANSKRHIGKASTLTAYLQRTPVTKNHVGLG